MNTTQSTVSIFARRLVTAAMLGCFLLAGWSWTHESSPKIQQAHAAVLRPAQTVEKRLTECHGCLSRANVENRSGHFHGSQSRGTRGSTQPLADGRDPVNSSPSVSDAEPRYVTKNIEDIRAGDYVLAREEHGDKIALRKVVEVYRRTSYHLRHLTFESEDGHSQTLQTTDEHPFWSVSRNAWVDAGDFQVGEQVTSPEGNLQTLTTTHRTNHPEGFPVFNFQVEGWHTYFVVASTVGKTPLLVHNADCWSFADNFQKAQGGTIVSLTPTRSPFIGNLPNDLRGQMLNHRFVTKEGKIFDYANPNGINAKEWFTEYKALNGFKSVKELRQFINIEILK